MSITLTRKQRDALHHLEHYGFRLEAASEPEHERLEQAVRHFQRAYAGPNELLMIDGLLGPKTRQAMQQLPKLSLHFSVPELWDKRERLCRIDRGLIAALEVLRAAAGGAPMTITSGYRTPRTNALVGGAKGSLHLYGLAADLGVTYDRELVYRTGRFSGLGLRHGRVSHVDVRHLMHPSGRFSPRHPSTWSYT